MCAEKIQIEVEHSEILYDWKTDKKAMQYGLRLAVFPKKDQDDCLFFFRKQRFSILRAFHSELFYHTKLVYGLDLPRFPSRHRIETIIGTKTLIPKREEELRRYYVALCDTLGTKLLDFTSFREFFDIDGEHTARFRARSILQSKPRKVKRPPFAARYPLKHRKSINAAGIHRTQRIGSSLPEDLHHHPKQYPSEISPFSFDPPLELAPSPPQSLTSKSLPGFLQLGPPPNPPLKGSNPYLLLNPPSETALKHPPVNRRSSKLTSQRSSKQRKKRSSSVGNASEFHSLNSESATEVGRGLDLAIRETMILTDTAILATPRMSQMQTIKVERILSSNIGQLNSNHPVDESFPLRLFQESDSRKDKCRNSLSRSDSVIDRKKRSHFRTDSIDSISSSSSEENLPIPTPKKEEIKISALIIDFGSETIRVRRTGTSFNVSFPAVVGTPKPNLHRINPKIYEYEQYIGADALSLTHCYQLDIMRPRARGTFVNVKLMYLLLEHCIFQHNDHIECEYAPDVIMISSNLLLPSEINIICEWLQDDWAHTHSLGFSQMFLASQQILALAATQKRTGVLVHLGYETSSVSVVYENQLIQNLTRPFPVCGKLLTDLVIASMEERDVFYYLFDKKRVNDRQKERAATEFKENFSYCTSSEPKDNHEKTPLHIKHFIGAMEDKQQCFAMGAFSPSGIGLTDCISLQSLIVDVIESAEVDLRKVLYGSIVLFGGSSKFPGFSSCLSEFLRKEMDSRKISHQVFVEHLDSNDCILEGGSEYIRDSPNFLDLCLNSDLETRKGIPVTKPCIYFC